MKKSNIVITAYEKNAKEHPSRQVELIALSIARFGWQQPIKVGKDGVIIVGHGRFMAYQLYAEKLQLKPMWVIDESGREISGAPEPRLLTEKEERAYRLADNQINALSGNNKALVLEELTIIDDASLIELTGFSTDLVLKSEESDDAVPTTPKKAQSKLGDLYELGNHKVLCGDSTIAESLARLTNGVKVDVFLTDPPYNVSYTGKTKDALTIENDEMSDSSFSKFLTDAFTVASAVMKQGGVFYIWHADSEAFAFRNACKDAGLLVRQCIIWNKNSLVMGRQDYQWKHEPCLYGWKEGASHNWYGDRNKTTVYKIPEDETKALEWFRKELKRQDSKNLSVIDMDRPSRSLEHPTMKPVELLLKQIMNSSKQEDIILDTFLGSGSTLIASEKSGRICYGMEIDPIYTDVCISRWCEYTGNFNIKKNGENIVWKHK